MATIKIFVDKKNKTASIWAYGDYIATVLCDVIEIDGPMTCVKWKGETIMCTSTSTEIINREAKE